MLTAPAIGDPAVLFHVGQLEAETKTACLEPNACSELSPVSVST